MFRPSFLRRSLDGLRDWSQWRAVEPVTILKPEYDWEGADLPIETSTIGSAKRQTHQLRDPACFVEGDKRYLLYSTAGESNLQWSLFARQVA